MGMDRDWVIRRETGQLNAATQLIAISEQIAERWRGLGHHVIIVQNGCDSSAYAHIDEAPPATDVLLPSPIAGLIGQLSNRLDWSYLEAVADKGISLLLIGPLSKQIETARFQRLISRSNVQWLGPRPFTELPSYLKTVKVGITPYVNSEFNRASFPLKTLEYLAAGCAAVVSDLPSCRTLATDLIRIAATPSDFADAVEDELLQSDTMQIRQQRQAFAQRHDWDRRAQEFATAIGLAPDP
jgi:teichuronic acid biosynthesis glycosyltransferase TuaH